MGTKKKHDKKGNSKYHILVVEDDKANLLMATLCLDDLGYKYDSAVSGEEAIKKVKKDSYDLILMDLNMRGRDGIETTKIIKSMEVRGEIEETPIIALTADDIINDKERCLEAGMDDYLTKPVDIDRLEQKLQFHIDRE